MSTWKPLQIPISGRPPATNVAQRVAEHDGEIERQHPPGAERVAVAETSGDDGDAGLVEHGGSFDELRRRHDRRVGPRQAERDRRVAIAVGAGTG